MEPERYNFKVVEEKWQNYWDKNKIYLYTPRMTSEKEIIKALLHEYTHATQDRKKFEKYREKGYANNPYEKAAHKAESNWRKYI